MIFFVILERKK